MRRNISEGYVAPVRRELSGGFEVDDDPARIDLDAVYDFLSNGAYWAKGRPRETVERLIREADRVVGVYAGERQIGFARAFTDGVAIAYLADVYVLPEFRGHGLGVELVREMIENGPYAGVKWLLHTTDAHGLYRKFGFDEPSGRVLERPG
jgi:GNAT superfamily N-acetyltransferase